MNHLHVSLYSGQEPSASLKRLQRGRTQMRCDGSSTPERPFAIRRNPNVGLGHSGRLKAAVQAHRAGRCRSARRLFSLTGKSTTRNALNLPTTAKHGEFVNLCH